MSVAIELDAVGKRFARAGESGGDYVALDGFTLSVRAGEFFCLLGPTGCGKSTVLHLVAGFEQLSAGRLQVFGAAVDKPDAPVIGDIDVEVGRDGPEVLGQEQERCAVEPGAAL